MPRWKHNEWRNSKKAGVAKKSPWIALHVAIAQHRRVEFSCVKAHSGLLHNEIADTLATRGVRGSTFCPTDRFDALPADTKPEDVPEMRGVDPLITQTEEYNSEDSMPQFSKAAMTYGFEADEAQDQADATFNRFSRDVLGNSSAQASDDLDVPQGQDTLVVTGDMTVEEPAPPSSFQFKTWSGNWTWPQTCEADRREREERATF
jgi:hypothetical protein